MSRSTTSLTYTSKHEASIVGTVIDEHGGKLTIKHGGKRGWAGAAVTSSGARDALVAEPAAEPSALCGDQGVGEETAPGKDTCAAGGRGQGAAEPADSLPAETLLSAKQTSGAQQETLASDALASETPPSGTPPSETLPSGALPSETLPSGTPPSETLPSGALPSETPPSEERAKALDLEKLRRDTIERMVRGDTYIHCLNCKRCREPPYHERCSDCMEQCRRLVDETLKSSVLTSEHELLTWRRRNGVTR